MRKIKWAAQYAWLTCKHKWFVLLADRRLGVSYWRLILHDLSKFGPMEIFAYGRQFFGDHGDPLGFSYAWLHHQRVNKHHWEAWILVTGHTRGGYADGTPLPMPVKYAREMVADFVGASRAYEGQWPKRGTWKWYEKNYPKIRLHPETRAYVDAMLHGVLEERKP